MRLRAFLFFWRCVSAQNLCYIRVLTNRPFGSLYNTHRPRLTLSCESLQTTAEDVTLETHMPCNLALAETVPPVDDLIPIREAARLFPRRRGGSRVSLTTLWRWNTRGSKGVRLATWVVGGARYTTRVAVDDFIAARSAADDASCTLAPSPSKASANAMRQLERMGL